MKNNKHILIFFCFNNFEHIKISFDSMYNDNIDYFIIENKSKYSEEIKNYFLEQKKDNIIRYIQFEKNISSNAINIFLKRFGDFLRKYEYVTITDGDYYIHDMKLTMQEIMTAFNHKDCAISSVDIYQGNHTKNPNKIIGIEPYNDFMKKRESINPNNIIGIGVPSLMTLHKKDLYILESIYYFDGNIRSKVNEVGKSWYITVKNQSYHLTNDLCYDGNEYMDWKKNYGHAIWHITEEANYNILI
jgi:hypothetical protein